MLIDTHTHLNFQAFKNDWQKVVKRAINAGVRKIIVVGTDIESSKRAVELSEKHEALYASIGIHPHHARGIRNKKLGIRNVEKELKLLLKKHKVVAIGEVGLDYHHYLKTRYESRIKNYEWMRLKKLQKALLNMQLKLAYEFNKPLIIHSREASNEVLQVLLDISKKLDWKPRGVFHCFEGGKKYLKKVLEAGFYLSFTGNITYSEERAEVSKQVPIDRLLLETDSPLLTPYPLRGKRNTPENVKIIAEKHADIRSLQYNEVTEQTTLNARMLFHI